RMALENPEVVRGLQNASNAESFGRMAVQLGAAQGCKFTVEEIGEWVRMKSDSNALKRGEPSLLE
ncbi:MAG TPA: hypothetical protein PLK99_10335, partial [Burkholderiales bacterium]|nr:hypothetical protein [Burkholderiales bacterium]